MQGDLPLPPCRCSRRHRPSSTCRARRWRTHRRSAPSHHICVCAVSPCVRARLIELASLLAFSVCLPVCFHPAQPLDDCAAAAAVSTLNLSRNLLSDLPRRLAQLPALRGLSHLDVSHNRLAAVPPAILQLQQLQVLDVSHNAIRALPPPLLMGGLPHLAVLRASHNAIEEIVVAAPNAPAPPPPPPPPPPRLYALLLSHNALAALPSDLDRLAALAILHVAHNRIGRLPDALGRLTALQALDVSSNRIRSVPRSLRALDLVSFRWGCDAGA